MRRAKPNELSENAFPVMTARLTEAELEEWFPVPFEGDHARPPLVPFWPAGNGPRIWFDVSVKLDSNVSFREWTVPRLDAGNHAGKIVATRPAPYLR